MSRAHCYSHSRAHSPTFPLLHLRHSSFSNPSVTLPTSKLILQPFRCFTYVIVHSPILFSLLLRHRLFSSPGEPPVFFNSPLAVILTGSLILVTTVQKILSSLAGSKPIIFDTSHNPVNNLWWNIVLTTWNFKGAKGWNFGNSGQKLLFYFIEQI